jgi:hypothetical protein
LAAGGERGGVAGIEWLPAGFAHHRRDQLVPAVVLEHQGRAVIPREVLVTPAHERGDDGVQVTSGVCQAVFEAGRVL